MLGVFKRRWKPKRVASDSIRPAVPESDSPERPLRAPPTRQIHPLSAEPNQLLAYDATVRRKTKTLKNATEFSEDANQMNHLAKKSSPPSPIYPMTQNICVEGGRIEFVKKPLDGIDGMGFVTPPSSPLSNRHFEEEKFDGDKEALEARIRQLEQRLEAEASNAQRDRMAVAKLQHQLAKREEGVSRDAEVARGEVHARLARAEHDAERANVRLRAAHRELARMEETVRSLLQYKSRVDALKQEKSTLSSALEARSVQYRQSLSRLSAENAALGARLATLQAAGRCLDDVAAQLVAALLHQKTLREELTRLSLRTRDLEAQNKALGALLLRQLRPKPAPSPASPPSPPSPPSPLPLATAAAYLRTGSLPSRPARDGRGPERRRRSDGGRLTRSSGDVSREPPEAPADEPRSRLAPPDDAAVCVSDRARGLRAEDKRRHQILADLWTELRGVEMTPRSLLRALRAVDPALRAPPERPLTLDLGRTAPGALSRYLRGLSRAAPGAPPGEPDARTDAPFRPPGREEEAAAESPESGNRDEGYSTMSSDVQVDPSRQGEAGRELEDLKEASDETDCQLQSEGGDAGEARLARPPLDLALRVDQRNSFPPSRGVSAFGRVARSSSDSRLCLRLAAAVSRAGGSYFALSSPASSSPSVLLLDVLSLPPRERRNPGERAGSGAERGLSDADERAEGCQFDAEYVQHWLRLDDSRSALQQRHRDLLEYDRAELEDWSLDLSCEDLRGCEGGWRRRSPLGDAATPGQLSASTLPSIRESDALELEEDASECLWNDSSYMNDAYAPPSPDGDGALLWPYSCLDGSEPPSPAGSWSSVGGSDARLGGDSASGGSSAALGASDDERDAEPSTVGVDFTRDFYRLVKFESTKSLNSTSSRGAALGAAEGAGRCAKRDRELALRSVLDFIAEQRRYCRDREELDSQPSRPPSEPEPRADSDGDGTPPDPMDGSDDGAVRADPPPGADALPEPEAERRQLPAVPEEEEPGAECAPARPGAPATVADARRAPPERSRIPVRIRPSPKRTSRIPVGAATVPVAATRTGDDVPDARPPAEDVIVARGPSHCRTVSFRESATSKDVIEELNRMIRKGEDGAGVCEVDREPCRLRATGSDGALWGPSGWVRVESDVDFSDPKARANLLDVMLASSDSSPSPTSSFAGSAGGESGDDGADYSKLHRLHGRRRQRKAAALRERGLAVLRFSCFHRPTIIGRDDFFVRYGKQERDAVACFDFLEEISPADLMPSDETVGEADGRRLRWE